MKKFLISAIIALTATSSLMAFSPWGGGSQSLFAPSSCTAHIQLTFDQAVADFTGIDPNAMLPGDEFTITIPVTNSSNTDCKFTCDITMPAYITIAIVSDPFDGTNWLTGNPVTVSPAEGTGNIVFKVTLGDLASVPEETALDLAMAFAVYFPTEI